MDTGQAPALLWESLARFGGVLSLLPRVEGGVGFGRRPFNVSDSGGYGACANPSRLTAMRFRHGLSKRTT